jgi:hypothetical protein
MVLKKPICLAIVLIWTMLISCAAGQSGQYSSLQSYNYPGNFIRHAYGLGELSAISSDLDQKDATFAIVPGLADSGGISFESYNYPGSYLRHQDGRLKLNDLANDSSPLFREDATFKIVSGLADSSLVSFEP